MEQQSSALDERIAAVAPRLAALRDNLTRVIQGKDECIDLLIVAMLAGGSVLLEDVPGVGKTTLAKALAQSVDATFHRVQFTPDLLPADILGSSVYNPVSGTFDFRRGPVFCNILLADEINRASPRTQSALLEAMNEQQATIEGLRHALPAPFFVLATQNPVDFHGTYPLPEAQLDRFLIWLDMGYPDPDVEAEILQAHRLGEPVDAVEPVLLIEEILTLQEEVRNVRVDPAISRYVINLAVATREDDRLQLGVSPRGSLMLSRAAQAAALLAGRDFVLPDDVQRLAVHVLAHRVMLTSKSRYDGTNRRELLADIVRRTKVPT